MKIKKIFEALESELKIDREVVRIMRAPFDEEDLKHLKFQSNSQSRYIVDGVNKKVYIFDGRLLHYKAAAELHIPYSQNTPESVRPYLFGLGYWNPDKKILENEEIYNITILRNFSKTMLDWRRAFKNLLKTNFSFADKYISGLSKELTSRKEEIERLENNEKSRTY